MNEHHDRGLQLQSKIDHMIKKADKLWVEGERDQVFQLRAKISRLQVKADKAHAKGYALRKG